MEQTIFQRIKRGWRHANSTNSEARRAFPDTTLAALAQAITEGERTHRGEVCLIVEKALPFADAWDGVSSRERALALFADFGIWDTEDNCGVLIYINLAEHKVDIVADRGIDRKIDHTIWQAVCSTLTSGFRAQRHHEAALAAIEQVNALLHEHFPATGPRANELPNHPVML